MSVLGPNSASPRNTSRISLILPAIDETHSLQETVRRCKQLLSPYALRFLIVTHPEFTTVACRAAIAKLAGEYGDGIEAFDQVRPGLGGAIQDALSRADGDVTVLMASDLETDPAALPAMIKKIEEGFDVCVATRWKELGGFSGYHPLKFYLKLIFQRILRLMYWSSLTDLTYAYRVYRTDVLRQIRWEELRTPFLLESILKPVRLGFAVTEVAAPWAARREGTSHNSLRQTLDYVRVGIRIRFQPRHRMTHTAAK